MDNHILTSDTQSGQICMSTERIVVQRSVADEFRQKLAETAEKLFGKDAPALVLVNTAAVAKNKKLVADAVSRGATLLFGDANASESVNTGMRPIVVDGVTKEMDMVSLRLCTPTTCSGGCGWLSKLIQGGFLTCEYDHLIWWRLE